MSDKLEPSTLERLTDEKLNKAFHEAVKETPVVRGRFVRLTPEYHEIVKRICCTEFESREALSLATGLKWNGPFTDDFWTKSLKQNLSVAIINEDNGDIMAVRVIRWELLANDDSDTSGIEDKATKKFMDFVAHCDREARFTHHFPTKEIFHFLGLVVPEKYSKQGLATSLMVLALNFLRHLNLAEIVVKGETSSPFSKRIYQKLGFKPLFETAFEDYIVNGEQVLNTYGKPLVFNVYGLLLQCATDI